MSKSIGQWCYEMLQEIKQQERASQVAERAMHEAAILYAWQHDIPFCFVIRKTIRQY